MTADEFKLKSCTECGCTQLVSVEIPEDRTFDGITYQNMLPVQECTQCKENYAFGMDVYKLEDKLVVELEKLDIPGQEAQKFMEKIKASRDRRAHLERLAAALHDV